MDWCQLHQGFVLRLLLILIYNNQNQNFWMFIVKMFSNDISPIFFVDNIDTSAAELQENLLWIKWTFQWKMRFNLDPNIKTKKVTFSRVIY